MRRWEVVVVAACVLLVLWAWWPRPQPDLPPPGAVPIPPGPRVKATEPQEVKADMAILGMTQPLASWQTIADTDSRATAFPYPSGAPANSYYYWLFSQPIGSWDDPISPTGEDPDRCYCTYAVLTPGGVPTALWAYLRLTAVTQQGRIAAGIYTEGGTCIVGSAAQLFTETYTGWVEFPVSTELALQNGTSYAIWVRADYDALNDLVELAYGAIDEYEPPVEPLEISGSDVLVLGEALSGYGPGFAASDVLVLGEALGNYGPGFAASDVLAFEENLRHGGVIAPCDGRFIPPEPEEHCTNPHRWNG